MRKVWDTLGGVHPPENKSQSNQSPIAAIPLPDELVLPLNQHIGAPAVVAVNVGDHVKKGQKIAEPQGYISAALHAPSSGIVSAIESRPINHPSGLDALCVVIEPDGKEEWIEKQTHANWRKMETSALVDIIRDSGITGMGGAGFPTSVKMTPRANQKIDTLILNGTECEPYITADDMLMRERAAEIIQGTEILAYVIGEPSSILIGVEDNKPEAAEAMRNAAAKSSANIDVVTFPTKYPSGGEKQLIQILTGKEVPSGGIPADIGMLVQNIGTARAVSRAVLQGEPLIERVTTVVGESLGTQQNIDVLVGTPIQHILEHHGFNADNCARIIIGGPMMGYAMEHTLAPIIKSTNCLLVPSKEEMPDPDPQQACIRCGMCAEACPADLLPQQLYWFSRSENFDQLKSQNLFDCIECGACSYVCPSNIPLVQYYRASKGAIRHHDEEKQKAEHSRQRFEFRKERLEKADAEKEAKRLARKKAAEAAKAKLADSNGEKETKQPEPKAAKASIDPAKTKAKLERALSSAESRVDRAEKALASAREEKEEATRIETLSARLKEAELKSAEAKKKLDAFTVGQQNADAGEPATKTVEPKPASSESESLRANVVKIEKRIVTAKEKVAEAEANGSATVDALKTGVSKLEDKLVHAKQALSRSLSEEIPEDSKSSAPQALNGADAAIAKAKARADSLANMSPEQKAKAQIESLNARLAKAELRLSKARENNDENIAAFEAGVEKLKEKLATAQDNIKR